MKKLIVILAVLCCGVALFAMGKNSITFKVVPYGFQLKNQGIYKDNKSSYLLGAETAYQRFIVEGLFIEGGVCGDFAIVKNAKFANAMMFMGVGYKCLVNKFFSTIHVDFASDVALYKRVCNMSIGLKMGTGVGYQFSDLFSMSLDFDASMTYFPEGDKTGIFYRLLPSLGMEFTF